MSEVFADEPGWRERVVTEPDGHAPDDQEIKRLKRLQGLVRRARHALLGATMLLMMALVLRCLSFWVPGAEWTVTPLRVALGVYLGASGWFWWLIGLARRRFEAATRERDT